MAACTFAVGTADTGNSPNTSGAFVPASGDLLVVLCQAAATVTDPASLTSSIGGFTFTQVAARSYSSGAHMVYAFIADALVSDTSSQSVTLSPADQATGTVIFVYRVSGMSKVGAVALKQAASESNGAAVTPGVEFASSCLTGNPTLGICANQTNGGTFTEPTGWTEPSGGDLSYGSPNIGAAVFHRDSGFTGTTVTWGAASASVHGEIVVELDASGAAAITSTPKRLPLVGVA